MSGVRLPEFMSSSLKKPKRRKKLRKSAKSAEKIPGELIPQSGIYVGMLERLFEAFGCKLTTVKVVRSTSPTAAAVSSGWDYSGGATTATTSKAPGSDFLFRFPNLVVALKSKRHIIRLRGSISLRRFRQLLPIRGRCCHNSCLRPIFPSAEELDALRHHT